IMLVALQSKLPLRETSEVADKRVRRQIESIKGVGQVNLIGTRKRQINVWLNPLELASFGLTPIDVQRAIASQNLTTPGGGVETGPTKLTLRLLGRVESPEALGRIIVREKDGHAVHLEDVARIEDGSAEESTYAALEGTPTVLLSIVKQSG